MPKMPSTCTLSNPRFPGMGTLEDARNAYKTAPPQDCTFNCQPAGGVSVQARNTLSTFCFDEFLKAQPDHPPPVHSPCSPRPSPLSVSDCSTGLDAPCSSAPSFIGNSAHQHWGDKRCRQCLSLWAHTQQTLAPKLPQLPISRPFFLASLADYCSSQCTTRSRTLPIVPGQQQ